MSYEAGSSFVNNFCHISMDLFKNQQKNGSKQAGSRLSLHFYSQGHLDLLGNP